MGFGAAFDAGALILWVHDRSWAKLCFEYSQRGKGTVVSVVTRDVSDDCTSFVVEASEVWLRVSRRWPAFVFHASVDGRDWNFIRHFILGDDEEPQVGFEAQSPLGRGCRVIFSNITFSASRLGELRNGE